MRHQWVDDPTNLNYEAQVCERCGASRVVVQPSEDIWDKHRWGMAMLKRQSQRYCIPKGEREEANDGK